MENKYMKRCWTSTKAKNIKPIFYTDWKRDEKQIKILNVDMRMEKEEYFWTVGGSEILL